MSMQLDDVVKILQELTENIKQQNKKLEYLEYLIINNLEKKSVHKIWQNYYSKVVAFILIVLGASLVFLKSWFGYERTIVANVVALIFLILGIFFKEITLRLAAYGLWIYNLGTAILLLVASFIYQTPVILWHSGLAVVTSFIICLSACCIMIDKKKVLHRNEFILSPILGAGALLSVVYWLSLPILPLFYALIVMCAYEIALFLIGIWAKISFVRYSAYVTAIIIAINSLLFYSYNYYVFIHPAYTLIINIIFGVFLLTALCVQIISIFSKKQISTKEYKIISAVNKLIIALLLFLWGYIQIILHFDHLKAQNSFFIKKLISYIFAEDQLVRTKTTTILLAIYTWLSGIISIVIGYFQREKLLQYFGLIIILFSINNLLIQVIDNKLYLNLVRLLLISIVIISLIGYKYFISKKRAK